MNTLEAAMTISATVSQLLGAGLRHFKRFTQRISIDSTFIINAQPPLHHSQVINHERVEIF